MKCSTCGAELDPITETCPRCEANAQPGDATKPPASGTSDGGPEPTPKRGDPDLLLWQANYSMRGMIGTWLILGLITILVVVLDVLLTRGPLQNQAVLLWEITLGLVALAWIVFLIIGWYRSWTLHYKLTTYRFYYQKGFIFRSVDSMEVIDIDDIALHQNLLERLVGVGRILLRTKDPSDPVLVLHGVPSPDEAFKKIDKARRDEQIRRSIKVQ